jgi:1,2-diacylglycerol 3-alpha-glucosyltransferase
MKILYLSDYPAQIISGSALIARKVARWMSKHHKVSFICPSRGLKTSSTVQDKIHLFQLPSMSNPLRRNYRIVIPAPNLLMKVLNLTQPDIVHVYDPSPAAIYLVKQAVSHDIPVVISNFFVPQFLFEYFKVAPTNTDSIHQNSLSVAMLKLLSIHYNKATSIVVLTDTIKNLLEPYFRTPIKVISASVDYHQYAQCHAYQVQQIRTKYLLSQNPTVLYVGRLDKDKNLYTFLKAWKIIVTHSPNNHMLMVGGGSESHKLIKFANNIGLTHTISWTGMLPEHDLPAIYNIKSLKAFLITSKVETQSIVTLQALASGLPVVAADSGALPELVIPDRTGYLCEPDDPRSYANALQKILDITDNQNSFKKNCQALAREHLPEKSQKAYIDLYRSIAFKKH